MCQHNLQDCRRHGSEKLPGSPRERLRRVRPVLQPPRRRSMSTCQKCGFAEPSAASVETGACSKQLNTRQALHQADKPVDQDDDLQRGARVHQKDLHVFLGAKEFRNRPANISSAVGTDEMWWETQKEVVGYAFNLVVPNHQGMFRDIPAVDDEKCAAVTSKRIGQEAIAAGRDPNTDGTFDYETSPSCRSASTMKSGRRRRTRSSI